MQPNPIPQREDPDQTAIAFVGATDPLRYAAPAASFDPEEKNGIVQALVQPRSRVLDVGCGTGATLKALRERLGCEVLGVEPHAGRAAAARQEGVMVLHGMLDAFDPDAVGRFDVVLLLDILEHLPDPAVLLHEVRAWLRPGGCVIASVPNVAHWTVRLALLRGRFDYADAGIMDATHVRWFTRKSFRRLFETAGYEIDHSQSSTGSWMPVYAFSAPWRWLPPGRRTRLLHRCKRAWPQLFGCQHIVRTRPAEP